MNLFSYIVSYDRGFAPNPFFGYCTLACCKPSIRRTAAIGDLVVGITPKARGHKLLYIMRVKERLTFAEYWNDARFRRKRASKKNALTACGDNIYRPTARGLRQLSSVHSNEDGTQNAETKRRDLSGQYVLISDDFVYFGLNPHPRRLPRCFGQMIVGRGHRRFPRNNPKIAEVDTRLIRALLDLFDRLPRGIEGPPWDWPKDDTTWQYRRRNRCGE